MLCTRTALSFLWLYSTFCKFAVNGDRLISCTALCYLLPFPVILEHVLVSYLQDKFMQVQIILFPLILLQRALSFSDRLSSWYRSPLFCFYKCDWIITVMKWILISLWVLETYKNRNPTLWLILHCDIVSLFTSVLLIISHYV